MKINILFLTIHILLFSLFSCSNDKDKEMEIPDGELYATMNIVTPDSLISTSNILFSVDNIMSFNSTTNELIFYYFTDEELEDQILKNDCYSLTLYIGNTMLFDSIYIHTRFSSQIYDGLTFTAHPGRGCYFINGFPLLDKPYYETFEKEMHLRRREESAVKIRERWNVFIKYMESKRKIVE